MMPRRTNDKIQNFARQTFILESDLDETWSLRASGSLCLNFVFKLRNSKWPIKYGGQKIKE